MKKSIVVIGNFDGVHVGHQALIGYGRSLAMKHDMDFSIVTFEPHPRAFFQKNGEPFRITPAVMKAQILSAQCDHYHALDFNADMVARSAEDFITDILVEKCNAGIVIVGADFQFGKDRTGNIQTLQSNANFETMAFDLEKIGDAPVSSSRIRDHLKNAEIEQANSLLGWDWTIKSEVIHGDKRGRELGYPTANMRFGDTLVPAHGIYAVKVEIGNKWYNGAANIGIRPMFESEEPLLEVFIFDFDEDLYGQALTVQPVQKIRNEMKFDDLNDLKSQMEKDCVIAQDILLK